MGVKTCQGTNFSRAAKLLKMNNSTLPKATRVTKWSAQKTFFRNLFNTD